MADFGEQQDQRHQPCRRLNVSFQKKRLRGRETSVPAQVMRMMFVTFWNPDFTDGNRQLVWKIVKNHVWFFVKTWRVSSIIALRFEYRYPRGESYTDLISRLEPMAHESGCQVEGDLMLESMMINCRCIICIETYGIWVMCVSFFFFLGIQYYNSTFGILWPQSLYMIWFDSSLGAICHPGDVELSLGTPIIPYSSEFAPSGSAS